MLKRIFLVLLGILLLGLVVALGVLSSDNSAFIVWFGLAAALLAPGGMAIISFALRANDREILSRLSKVPQIEKLIIEAQTQEERIRALELERDNLTSVVQFEAKRQILLNKKDGLEDQAAEILRSLEEIENNLKELDIKVENANLGDAIKQLRERIKYIDREKVTLDLGFRKFVFDPKRLRRYPAGEILLSYIAILEEVDRLVKKIIKRKVKING